MAAAGVGILGPEHRTGTRCEMHHSDTIAATCQIGAEQLDDPAGGDVAMPVRVDVVLGRRLVDHDLDQERVAHR